VPEAFWAERSKPEIALAELQHVMHVGMSLGAVVADAGYGVSAPFRQALSALRLKWSVGTVRIQKVCLDARPPWHERRPGELAAKRLNQAA
jgi:SRSO17 transposase